MWLRIDPRGGVLALYGEALDVRTLGDACFRRAGRIDPDLEGRWFVDLGGVGGGVLGPYASRLGALEAEQEWLGRHLFGAGPAT